jgi:AraC-like DNA-binding protein
MNSIALQIPRELVPLRPAQITGYSARTLSARAPAMRLLAGYIGQLCGLAADFTAEQRRDAADAAINLLGMALRDTDVAVPGGDASGDVLLRMMCQHVRDYVGDRRLSVAELARRHHISERHVYALFDRMGVTAAGFTDPRAFERAFRRQYEMTPGRWRRAHRAAGHSAGMSA